MAQHKRGRLFASRSVKRIAKAGCLLVLCYVLIVLVGLISVNNDFQPAIDGVQIYITSNAVHADVIVPLSNEVIDWRHEFPDDTFGSASLGATHIAFGWGDQGFFIETPTWADLKVSTAANALLIPSNSCLHVVKTRADDLGSEKQAAVISTEQYTALVEFIKQSFATDEAGQMIPIPGAAYGANDAFFEACGTYHALNTCNSWAGRALRSAGVRVPWLTPMPKSPMLYLPAVE